MTPLRAAVWVKDFSHTLSGTGLEQFGTFMSLDLADNVASPWQAAYKEDALAYGARRARQWHAQAEDTTRFSSTDNTGPSEPGNDLVSRRCVLLSE